MRALLHLDAEALPRSLVWEKPLTDEEFEELCFENDDVNFERTKEGEIRMTPLTGGLTGSGNAEIGAQLHSWWRTLRRGRVFDSSAGFFLPDGSMFNPDAAYIGPEKLATLSRRELERLPHICPDFIIELLSRTDSLHAAKEKMESWIANGTSLAWLVDPYRRNVLVYRPNSPVEIFAGSSIQGEGPVAGFTLDLNEVWQCYEL